MTNTILTLVLGATYLTTGKKRVKLVAECPTDSIDYQAGFRFLGDDGIKYCEDGSVRGHLGDLPVIQEGARSLTELVEEEPNEISPEVLEDTIKNADGDLAYFRTKMGSIIALIGNLSEEDRFYPKGYRFVSDQGSLYRADGITAPSGLWTGLNIVDRVPADAVSEEDKERIYGNIRKFEARQRFYPKMNRFLKRFVVPLEVGMLIGFAMAA